MTAIDPRRLAQKVRLRVILPTTLFMMLSSLDRTNVSFGALQMNHDLGFSPAQYGFGVGVLFIGFLAGQYPSVLLLQRVGMKVWLSCSAIAWGVIAGAMAAIHTPAQFYMLRVALGLIEGGLAPGVVLYLAQFATERERASTFAFPMLAIPFSVIVGGPISGALMQMQPPLGIAGWRWMFLIEAIPTILLGAAAYFVIPNGPKDCRWLDAPEKEWFATRAKRAIDAKNDWSVLREPVVWMSSLIWFCLLSGSYGIMFWLPQAVKQLSGLSPFEIGLVNALPWIGNIFGIYWNAAHSDKSGERFWHIAVPAAIAGLGLLAAAWLGAGVPALMALLVVGTALGAAQGAFWALPTALFVPATFAVGAVAINISGSSGGLVTPQLIGLLREHGGGFAGPTLLLTAMLLATALLVLVVRYRSREAREPL
ncbi:MFS family permease [Sphingomonas vulcanisoli]|uniref:MFS family permease n=1 Tax=Sphingomonas vulcanisoli TaxID=1658060 RepID=A0ABX0TT59_9SPHN|nr:MFS transporter [Sphingomonas vulcanisoli]NIJ07587.1 MFS family permease [Sphingomonas vulcanisoli]